MSAIGGVGAGAAREFREEESTIPTAQEPVRPEDGSSEQSVNVRDLTLHIDRLIKSVRDIEADIKASAAIDEEAIPESGPQLARGVTLGGTSRQSVFMERRRQLVSCRFQAAAAIKQLFERLLENGEIDRAIRVTGKLSKKLNVNISDLLLTYLSAESIVAFTCYINRQNVQQENLKILADLLYRNFGFDIEVTNFFTSTIIPIVMHSVDIDFQDLRAQVTKISQLVKKDLNDARKLEIKALAEAARIQPRMDDGNGPGAGAGV